MKVPAGLLFGILLAVGVCGFWMNGLVNSGPSSEPPLHTRLARKSPSQPQRQEDEQPETRTGKQPRFGTVEGTVVYKADPKRRWRYARYYVKDRKRGLLAEAVVGLRGRALKNLKLPAKSKTAVIDQKNFRFVPETIAVRAGGRVKFTNSDPQLHNVFSRSVTKQFSLTLKQGDEQVELFGRAGGTSQPVWLGCRFHGGMRAWIFVFDHPYFQMTAENGQFRLENVPPGEYRLEMVHPSGELRWRKTIEVTSGQPLKIAIEVSPDNLFQILK